MHFQKCNENLAELATGDLGKQSSRQNVHQGEQDGQNMLEKTETAFFQT